MGRTFWQITCVALMACGGSSSSSSACGGAEATGGGSTERGGTTTTPDEADDLEAIRAAFPEGTEVTPFSGWEVSGLRLFRANWSEPDNSNIRVVGVDASSEVIRGADLMRRFGEVTPQDLALRANAILLPFAGQEPLSPGFAEWGNAQEQALIRDPRVAEGVLCYFAVQGEMNPGIVERCVQLSDYSVTTRHATELILAGGDSVVDENTICIAHSACGHWEGCVRAQRIQRPGNETSAYQVVESGIILELFEDCLNGVCFDVCRSASQSAHCDSGTYAPVDIACSESFPPSRADYHCETLADECRQVPH
ncbi:MAG: hypothetical protein ACI9KE_005486 [Polyangiales bacterium]|jgi:hypothetical protein